MELTIRNQVGTEHTILLNGITVKEAAKKIGVLLSESYPLASFETNDNIVIITKDLLRNSIITFKE